MKKGLVVIAVIALVVVALLASAAIYLAASRPDTAPAAKRSGEPVVFRIYAPKATSVFVTGSFNSWQTVEYRLDKKERGMWETTVLIAPGRYEYKFVVDSTWVHDVENPIKVPVPLPFTGYNSVLEVRSSRQDSLANAR